MGKCTSRHLFSYGGLSLLALVFCYITVFAYVIYCNVKLSHLRAEDTAFVRSTFLIDVVNRFCLLV